MTQEAIIISNYSPDQNNESKNWGITGSSKKKHPKMFDPISPVLTSRFCSTTASWNRYITGLNLSPGWSKSDYLKPSNSKKCKKYRFSKITRAYNAYTVNCYEGGFREPILFTFFRLSRVWIIRFTSSRAYFWASYISIAMRWFSK